ncbi:hypothetical protein EV691_14324 [Azotobacter chroococcum]|uniref:Uncharacterized protein n=1 Tax=Azotobacter chroococcum TaxID=353 RepID=A0A4R1P151_9GAMM|nr:hypothetical protein EV691_14324 [Azotobacter chroococcum]
MEELSSCWEPREKRSSPAARPPGLFERSSQKARTGRASPACSRRLDEPGLGARLYEVGRVASDPPSQMLERILGPRAFMVGERLKCDPMTCPHHPAAGTGMLRRLLLRTSHASGACASTTSATPAQGVSAMWSRATMALPSVSPRVMPRLNAEMFSAEAKSTARGASRSAVASMPAWKPGDMPKASAPQTNSSATIGSL